MKLHNPEALPDTLIDLEMTSGSGRSAQTLLQRNMSWKTARNPEC
jgi:hypothetical protein